MIVPIIIQGIFGVGVVVSVIFGLYTAFGADEGYVRVFGFIFGVVIGPLLVRLYCEFLIVVFRINETLTEIRSDLRRAIPKTGTDQVLVCQNCGSENPQGTNYCRSCGQPLAKL
jgi:hypothetical protein